jgi:hypothetical protein
MQKSNKSIAGYHLLMILSAVDYKFHPEEEKVILEYLESEFPFFVSLDAETEIIANLAPSEWKKHFEFHAKCFYDDSIEKERDEFRVFAKKLIKANDDVTAKEHKFYSLMKEIWKMN